MSNHSSPCRSCTLATLPSGSPTKVELGDGVLSLHIAPRTTALNVVIDLSPRLMRELRRSGSSDGSPVRPPVTPSSLGPVRVGTSRSQRVASVGPYSHSRVASRVNTKGGAAPAIINDPFAISQDGPSLPSPVAGPSALSLAHRVPGEASLPSGSLTHTGTQSGTVAVVGPDVLPAPKPANAPAVAIRRNVDITKPHINDDRNRVLALICAYSERKGCVMCDLHGHEYQHHETRCPRAFDYTNPGYAEFLRLVAFVPAPACMHCWLPLKRGGENFFHPFVRPLSWCPNSDLPKRVMFDIFRFREEHLQELCDDLQNEGSVPLGVFSDIYAWTMWLQLKPDNVARVLIALANRWLQANMTQAVAL